MVYKIQSWYDEKIIYYSKVKNLFSLQALETMVMVISLTITILVFKPTTPKIKILKKDQIDNLTLKKAKQILK